MAKEKEDITKIKFSEVSLVPNGFFNENQVKILLKKTPEKFIKKRKIGKFEVSGVSGGYIKKMLNLIFTWDWDFEVVRYDVNIEAGQVITLGKLTCRSNGKSITKMQTGCCEIDYNNKKIVNLGNSIKASNTDALKKCASEIGIASDIYNKEEFREVEIENNQQDEYNLKDLRILFIEKEEFLSPSDMLNIERIIEKEEENSYKKAITHLRNTNYSN